MNRGLTRCRGIVAAAATLAVSCAIVPARPAFANPYSSPGTLSDAGSSGGLGGSVSIAGDGTVAVVGEPGYAGGVGSVVVYASANGTWTFVQRLAPTGEVGAGHFGAAVSMDTGGQEALVGAPDDSGGVGAAWQFGVTNGQWTERGELLGGGWESGAGKFGSSVALASGGYLALVGAPMSNGGQGQAMTYQADYNTHAWSGRQRMDLTGIAVGDHFGASVALSNNSDAAIVGAPGASSGDGAVHPFTFFGLESQQWLIKDVIASPAPGGHFGASVSLAGAGRDVIIGAPLANNGDGLAYEYRANGSGMQEAVFRDPAGSTGGHFGASVALGGTMLDQAMIGAPGDGAGAGAAYEFDGTCGRDWTTDGAAVAPAAPAQAGDAYGSSVSLASSGSNALIGASGAAAGDGAVIHVSSPTLAPPCAPWFVQATGGPERADVSWYPPSTDGGSPITGYTVTSSPDGRTCTTTGALACTVVGLTAGAAYTFSVTATNGAGTSAPSASSSPVTPTTIDAGTGGGGTLGGGTTGGGTTSGGGTTGGGGTLGGGTTGGGTTSGGGRATTLPAAPVGPLRVSARTRTSLTIIWGASRRAVAGYRVYERLARAWKLVGSTTAKRRWFVRSGLRHATRYLFEVRAFDAAGHLSTPLLGRSTTR